MKLSEVDDATLSRWIAEKLEPFVGLPSTLDYDSGDRSPLQCWTLEMHSDGVLGAVGFWHPRDIVNDPSMTLMLMERGRIHVTFHNNGTVTAAAAVFPSRNKSKHADGQLKRAVAEAFCLAQGWTHGSAGD